MQKREGLDHVKHFLENYEVLMGLERDFWAFDSIMFSLSLL